MKKFLPALLVFVMALTMQSSAQDTSKVKKENFAWQKQYMDEAGIPAEIQAKIEIIKADYDVKLKEVRKDKTLGDEARKEKSKELYRQKADEIMALLTKEQKEKIKAIKERLKKAGEGSPN